MGIKLDWEVESEAGWSEVGEDAAALAARRRRNRMIRMVGLVLLAIMATAGGIMGWRLYSVSRQLREDLNTIVEIEARSLRDGNRSTYLSMQAEYEEWQREQSDTFDEYQALAERVQVSGEIVSLDITADQARVVIEEIYEGKPYHVTWFYTRTEDGWRHVPANPNQWGTQNSFDTVHFRISYHAEDEALARRLAVQVDKWWDAACRVTDCAEAPTAPQIRIEPDPLEELGWASYNNDILIIPSPGLGRVPADGSDDPMLFPTVGRYLAGYWADSAIYTQANLPRKEFSEVEWLRNELAVYVNHRFDETAPQSGFFNPLVEKHGPSIVRKVISVMPPYEGVFSFPSLLEEETGMPIDQINVDWGTYLVQRLRAESALIGNGYFSEARLLYGDNVQREVAGGETILTYASEANAVPESIELLSSRKVGELIWIEVRYSLRSPEEGEYAVFEPYRFSNGQWVHAAPMSTDWGGAQMEEAQHIRLLYYDLDAVYAEGLSPYIDQLYRQAAVDFGIDPTSLRTVDVSIQPEGFTEATSGDVVIGSLYTLGYDPSLTPSSYVQSKIMWHLISKLLAERAPAMPINHPIGAAFITWEMDRRGMDGQAALTDLLGYYGHVSNRWMSAGADPLSFTPPYEDADYAEARALLDVLVERYGERAIVTLLDNIATSSSVDNWLINSFGISFSYIEADWQAELQR